VFGTWAFWRVPRSIRGGARKSRKSSAKSMMRRPRPPDFRVCRACWFACFPLGFPPGVSPNAQPLWPEFSKDGSWLVLDRPFVETLPAFAGAIAKWVCPAALEEIERTWVLESDDRLSGVAGASVLSWDALGPLRREFLRRLNAVQRDLRSVDQTSEDLGRADINRLLVPAVAANPRVREFVRTLFLSGNGSLLFGNSFVEWGATEALRRAQPQVLIASFGVRKKLKPFSSVVLFEDQSRSNPVPDEGDPAGSLVDAAM